MTSINNTSQLEDDLLSKRLIIISGKGGVGKTTTAGYLASLQAERNKKTLIVEMNAIGQIPQLFHKQPSTSQQETSLAKNLSTLNLIPQICFEEYVIMQIKFKTLYKTFLDNTLVNNFISATPGLDELVMLGKIFDLERLKDPKVSTKPLYDCIIVDAPATGHGLSALEVPYIAYRTIKVGPIANNAKRMIDLFEDKTRTALTLVTLLEELPVTETLEFCENLKSRTNIAVHSLFLNQILPQYKLSIASQKKLPSHLQVYKDYAKLANARFDLQQTYKHKLIENFKKPTFELPFLFSGVSSKQHLEKLKSEEAR